jgi:hypothetical protein
MSVGFIPTLSAHEKERRGLAFASERSAGVHVVFEWDHRVVFLEPFKMMHKGIFA